MPAVATRYITVTHRRLDLGGLSQEERLFLKWAVSCCENDPKWTKFYGSWRSRFLELKLPKESVVHAVCEDLERRLAIEQGEPLPCYGEVLAENTREKFATRKEFCEAAQIDPGLFSRVKFGNADLSIRSLKRAAEVLGLEVTLLPKKAWREELSVERALNILGGVLNSR